MNKGIALFGASLVALGAMGGSVEAKRVYYEIDGQRYSYSTNNRRQVEEARQRIETAQAAAAAKAKADAEVAANPLVRLFGSPTQTEASQAQAQAQALQTQQAAPPPEPRSVETTSSIGSSRTGRRHARGRAASRRQEVRLLHGRRPAGKDARHGQPSAAPAAPTQAVADARVAAAAPMAAAPMAAAPMAAASMATAPMATASSAMKQEPAAPAGGATKPAAGLIAEPIAAPGPRKQAVKSVSFDLGSGIKTVEMTDGTIHEEPFDSATLAKLGSAEPAADSLAGFVDQVRKASPAGTASSGSATGGSPAKN